VVCSKESISFLDEPQDWPAEVAERDGVLAFVEAKRVGLNAGTGFPLVESGKMRLSFP
jgi:hypothetical protein